MINVKHLKSATVQLPVEQVAEAVLELRMEGLVLSSLTPFNRLHFNTCFNEVKALLQRAGHHRPVEVQGYQGRLYALYDPSRWQPMQVLRWLKALDERAGQQSRHPACEARRTRFFQG